MSVGRKHSLAGLAHSGQCTRGGLFQRSNPQRETRCPLHNSSREGCLETHGVVVVIGLLAGSLQQSVFFPPVYQHTIPRKRECNSSSTSASRVQRREEGSWVLLAETGFARAALMPPVTLLLVFQVLEPGVVQSCRGQPVFLSESPAEDVQLHGYPLRGGARSELPGLSVVVVVRCTGKRVGIRLVSTQFVDAPIVFLPVLNDMDGHDCLRRSMSYA